jgi:hypothetical protein
VPSPSLPKVAHFSVPRNRFQPYSSTPYPTLHTPVSGSTRPRSLSRDVFFTRPLVRRRVHGARCMHLSNCMPYRDPARRAAWMREYRKRKRAAQISAPVSRASSPSIVRAPEPSHVPQRVKERPDPQPARPSTRLVREGTGSSPKTALELARFFPIGVHGSQVCAYCYNSGYSSPGTRCSYCQKGERQGRSSPPTQLQAQPRARAPAI